MHSHSAAIKHTRYWSNADRDRNEKRRERYLRHTFALAFSDAHAIGDVDLWHHRHGHAHTQSGSSHVYVAPYPVNDWNCDHHPR